MLYFHYTEKLIDLQDLIVKNVAQDQNSTTIFAQMPRKPHNCPCCHTSTDKIRLYNKCWGEKKKSINSENPV